MEIHVCIFTHLQCLRFISTIWGERGRKKEKEKPYVTSIKAKLSHAQLETELTLVKHLSRILPLSYLKYVHDFI